MNPREVPGYEFNPDYVEAMNAKGARQIIDTTLHKKHWHDRHTPESTIYYTRLSDGNYYRIPNPTDFDGLPNSIAGIEIAKMKKLMGEYEGDIYLYDFPDRLTVGVMKYMFEHVEYLKSTVKSVAESNRQPLSDNQKDAVIKVMERKIKRLEDENKYYIKEMHRFEQQYIFAGHKISDLTAEVKHLKAIAPVVMDNNKTDSARTQRFTAIDI